MGEQAPVWGLGNPGFHLKDAAECCAACQAHARVRKGGLAPQIVVASAAGAKVQREPRLQPVGLLPGEAVLRVRHPRPYLWRVLVEAAGDPPRATSRHKDPHEGQTFFPQSMRKSPRNVWPWAVDPKIRRHPERVPWISVLAPADAVVRSAAADDPWQRPAEAWTQVWRLRCLMCLAVRRKSCGNEYHLARARDS